MWDEGAFQRGWDIGQFMQKNWTDEDKQDLLNQVDGLAKIPAEDRFIAAMVASKPNCELCVSDIAYAFNDHTAGTEQHATEADAQAADLADQVARQKALDELMELLDTDDE